MARQGRVVGRLFDRSQDRIYAACGTDGQPHICRQVIERGIGHIIVEGKSDLDDDPGDGDPNDGDPEGQSNLYLFWETDDIVDTKDSWQMTVGLVEKAPQGGCTASITPRRVQQFKPKVGAKVHWTNKSVDTGREIQAGQAVVDELGLITLPEVRIEKGKNRLAISL